MRRALVLVPVLLLACGGSAAAPPAASPSAGVSASPAPVASGGPLSATVTVSGTAATFQGGDDHMVVRVENHGRRIERFVVSAAGWLEEHSFAMGSTRLCDQDATERYIECGPIPAGATVGYTLRSYPNAIGDFEFEFRPYERAGTTLVPIPGPGGTEQVLTLREKVTAVTDQLPGYRPDPTPS